MHVFGIVEIVGGIEKYKVHVRHCEHFHMPRYNPLVGGVVVSEKRLVGPVHVVGGAFHAVGIAELGVLRAGHYLTHAILIVEHRLRALRRGLQFGYVVNARARKVSSHPHEIEHSHVTVVVGLFSVHGRYGSARTVYGCVARLCEIVFVQAAAHLRARGLGWFIGLAFTARKGRKRQTAPEQERAELFQKSALFPHCFLSFWVL